MVDLPVRWGALLIAAALLASCTGSPRLPVVEQRPSNYIRATMASELVGIDTNRGAIARNALLLARMGGGMSDHGFDSFADQLDPVTITSAADAELTTVPNRVEALRQWFHANAAQVAGGGARQVAEVPADYRIVEGIAYDQATGRLFIGTVVDGRLAFLETGAWHEVPIGFPRGGLFGMAIDARRRLLWIATGMVEQTAARNDPMAGLIAVDLDTLAVVERVRSPNQVGVPGDVAVGADGTVYLSDSKSGAIQRHRRGGGLFDLVPPGHFESPQGMALSRDGRQLYVADYATGLWVVRLGDRSVARPVTRYPMMLDGIDGLMRVPNTDMLIAVQNGVVPRRVSEITLAPHDVPTEFRQRGPRIDRLTPLHVVPKEAGDPSLGTLVNGELWFVGDGQWERYGPGGVLKDGKPPRPTPIFMVAP